MPISINCLKAALDPFIPGPFDLLPTGKIDNWLNPPRMLAKASASRFGLDEAEFPIFDGWWALSEPARKLHKDKDHAAAAQHEVEEAFKRVAGIVDQHEKYDDVGFRHVARVPGSGRFVVFSDHHMAFPGSRQDFFKSSGNSELYAEILTQYADTGFTLVENGDVEELIIHEPMLPPATAPARARKDWRLAQLTQVIANHRSLYEQINDQFVATGRYVRLAGNHDQDLQDERFLDVLRTVYPDLEQVYDFLVLETTDVGGPRYVIGHGHHFDKSATPKFSKKVGELLSECLAWAYEGADRVWRWDGTDGVQRWAGGGEPFLNTLVTDDPDKPIPIDIDVEELLLAWLGSLGLVNPWEAIGGVAGAIDILTGELSKESLWEGLFDGNIAWDYFQSDDAAEAVLNEMFCGERWFKMRHLDEVFINDRLETLFRKSVPNLILGHSHEPRHEAWDPARGEAAGHYLNSGSVGRFGNLLWGIEIIDGVAQVIGWHRPGGPDSGAAPERRVYTPESAGLQASEAHVALPALEAEEDQRRPWLEPVLHMMRS